MFDGHNIIIYPTHCNKMKTFPRYLRDRDDGRGSKGLRCIGNENAGQAAIGNSGRWLRNK